MENMTINGKIDKNALISEISRERLGAIPGRRVFRSKKLKAASRKVKHSKKEDY